jgi:hypothetical protein
MSPSPHSYVSPPLATQWFETLPAAGASAHSRALGAFYVCCNHSGPWRSELMPLLPGLPRPGPFDTTFIGRSCILDPNGKVGCAALCCAWLQEGRALHS